MTENKINMAPALTGMTFSVWKRLARWTLKGEGLAKHDRRGSWGLVETGAREGRVASGTQKTREVGSARS